MGLNHQILKLLHTEYIDIIGFADISKYRNEIYQQGGSIVTGYIFGISFGIALNDSIVDYLSERRDLNIACEYKTHCYNVINNRLDIAASKLSSFLIKKGYKTLPIPSAERTDIENAYPTVSHKTIAHIAGLGWIGKNCLLITPEYGPRVRLITVLTNAPIKAIDKPMVERCGDCMECVSKCPTKAIKGNNYRNGEDREIRFDFTKCQKYFETLRLKTEWNVCGMCLNACPVGGKRTKNVLTTA